MLNTLSRHVRKCLDVSSNREQIPETNQSPPIMRRAVECPAFGAAYMVRTGDRAVVTCAIGCEQVPDFHPAIG